MSSARESRDEESMVTQEDTQTQTQREEAEAEGDEEGDAGSSRGEEEDDAGEDGEGEDGDKEKKRKKDGKNAKDLKDSKGGKPGKSGKRSKAPNTGDMVRKRTKKKTQTYALYIYKVLKQIHPNCGISKRGMNIMNSFMNDMFDRLATESTKLLRHRRIRTLSNREIE